MKLTIFFQKKLTEILFSAAAGFILDEGEKMTTAAEKTDHYEKTEIQKGFEAAFLNSAVLSDENLRPSFLSNIPKQGKKVLTEIEDLLLSCDSYFLSVAFITMDGLTPLLETLKELDEKGVKGRILTTDYLAFSDPRALDRLNSLPSIELRMFNSHTAGCGLHTKGYVFRKDGTYRIVIGSSNITARALTLNREWNTKLVAAEDGELTKAVISEFEELWKDENTHLYDAVRDEYHEEFEITRKQRETALQENPVSFEKYTLSPNSMQVGFITNLKRIIESGEDRALLISATGTGKTYASAFAMRELGYRRVLFLVHRGQLAEQTRISYEKVFGSSVTFGIMGAGKNERNRDYIFALVQTLSKDDTMHSFPPDYFDCIILDEAHHSAAGSYKKILSYFKPRLWLGMTATPDKRDDNIDGRNIYEIFNYQIAYEIRLKEAMEENLLCPFHYFGLTDIAVVSEQKNLSPEDFNRLVASERVDRIIEKAEYFGYSGTRVKGLVFCSRIDESERLSEEFNERGYRTIALNGDSSPEERAKAFERLGSDNAEDRLDYIFSVDILNEGVDIVEVNQVIMLRPTESPIVFIQQLGRGLRKARGKDYVVVLDFIGNYDNNFMIPVALSGDRSYNRDTIRKYVISGNNTIPGASTIHFDRIAKERIFDSINRFNGIKKVIKESYTTLKTKLGRRPYLEDFYSYNEADPLLIIKEYRTYQNFIRKVDGESCIPLTQTQETILEYLSKTVLSGVRPYELEILSLLLSVPFITYDDIRQKIKDDYGFTVDDDTITCAVKVLKGCFVNKDEEIAKYGVINVLTSDSGTVRRGDLYREIAKSEEYRRQFEDIIKVGKERYRDRYHTDTTDDSRFVLYEKYSRRDVSLLINAGKDLSSVMYGKYRKDNDVFIFVTYHKQTTEDETKEYISGKPDYSDRFENNSIFLWDSQIGRGPESSYMADVENATNKHLLIKKSDAESSFYYMGLFDVQDRYGAKKKDNKGVERDITKVILKMHNSVRDDLLRYLESSIEEKEGIAQ